LQAGWQTGGITSAEAAAAAKAATQVHRVARRLAIRNGIEPSQRGPIEQIAINITSSLKP